MFRGVAARVDDVVHGGLGRNALALSDLTDSLWPESPLGVYVNDLAVSAAKVRGQLGNHGQRVADLGLSAAELAEELSDRAALDAASEHLIQLGCACGQREPVLEAADQLRARHETCVGRLPRGIDDLVHLLVGQAFDAQQVLAHREDDGLARVVARIFQFFKVRGVDARVLQLFDQVVGKLLLLVHFALGVHPAVHGRLGLHLHGCSHPNCWPFPSTRLP
mmetsp:Transcript_16228/g.44464  ORF Transcript_16228/g.44464 Transcript_16228/m.44464 type:complete len:221 (+) Transcript_16228:518-1180(+)